jgi:hypothetical protein
VAQRSTFCVRFANHGMVVGLGGGGRRPFVAVAGYHWGAQQHLRQAEAVLKAACKGAALHLQVGRCRKCFQENRGFPAS